MTRSFRFQLAIRQALVMALGLLLVSAAGFLALRATLDDQLNSSLLNVASIQAGALTEAPTGEMAFHEWELTPEEAASVRDLNRYAQVWSEQGESLLRTRQLARDLPLDTAALLAAARGHLAWTEQRLGSLPIRSLYYPLGRLGHSHERHVVQVAAPLDARNRVLRITVLFLLALSTLGTAGAFASGWWLANRAIRPVHAIIDHAESIQPGEGPRRIQASADMQEYERLIQVLNLMLARLDHAFEAQRRFTADASHELRSPLTALRGELELARRRERSAEEYRRVIASALEEVERLSRVAEDLLTLARSDAGVMQPRFRESNLAACASRTVARLRGKATEKRVELRLSAPAEVNGLFDEDLIGRLLWNLTENALKFTPPAGWVELAVSARGGDAVIEVADTGPGIPEEDRSRVFDRFFQIDQSRTPGFEHTGSGLGLSIAHAIVEMHDGEICVQNRPQGGALFRVRIPRDGCGVAQRRALAPGAAEQPG